MTRTLRITISALALAAVLLALVPLTRDGGRVRSELVCAGVDVRIHENGLPGFVRKEHVMEALEQNYGTCTGRRIESLNLGRIEEVVHSLSAVRKGDAYVTPDGMLHIEIFQREPVLMFRTPERGYYADAEGFVFPLVSGYDAPLTTVSGRNPLNISDGYRGLPKTEKERKWLADMLAFKEYMDSDKTWKGAFRNIDSDAGGDIRLTPVIGKEVFLFGRPDGIKDKFRRMEDYYKYIAPEKDPGWYRTVNVKFDGQIVCRR